MNKKYKMVISDFDGTLTGGKDSLVGENTLSAIRALQAAGGIFAVCTGRMLTSILPVVRKIGLSGPVASYQGSVIADIQTGELLRADGFDEATALSVCRFMEENGLDIHLYTMDTLYTNYYNERLAYYEQVCAVKAVQKEKLSDCIPSLGRVIKLAATFPPERLPYVMGLLDKRFGAELYVTSSAKILAEIMPKNQNKGEAVKFIAAHYGVNLSDVIAVGDNYNDLPMLKAAGLGVAVGNAEEALKSAADDVAPPSWEDGVGYIINKYCL